MDVDDEPAMAAIVRGWVFVETPARSAAGGQEWENWIPSDQHDGRMLMNRGVARYPLRAIGGRLARAARAVHPPPRHRVRNAAIAVGATGVTSMVGYRAWRGYASAEPDPSTREIRSAETGLPRMETG